MTVDEVHHSDLAHAPPFGPVYDAIIDVCGKAALELCPCERPLKAWCRLPAMRS